MWNMLNIVSTCYTLFCYSINVHNFINCNEIDIFYNEICSNFSECYHSDLVFLQFQRILHWVITLLLMKWIWRQLLSETILYTQRNIYGWFTANEDIRRECPSYFRFSMWKFKVFKKPVIGYEFLRKPDKPV